MLILKHKFAIKKALLLAACRLKSCNNNKKKNSKQNIQRPNLNFCENSCAKRKSKDQSKKNSWNNSIGNICLLRRRDRWKEWSRCTFWSSLISISSTVLIMIAYSLQWLPICKAKTRIIFFILRRRHRPEIRKEKFVKWRQQQLLQSFLNQVK